MVVQNDKDIVSRIPRLPLSALIFYLMILLLWELELIPSPQELVMFFENLYKAFGYWGLFLASFLEGLVYVGLYVPGAFIIALSVFFSDGSFGSLLLITMVVTIALTLVSILNYCLGRYFVLKRIKTEKILEKSKIFTKGIFIAILHPNFLSFYFFKQGLEKGSPSKLLLVPVLLIPYGLLFAYVLSIFSDYFRKGLESPILLLSIILVWLVISCAVEYKKEIRDFTERVFNK